RRRRFLSRRRSAGGEEVDESRRSRSGARGAHRHRALLCRKSSSCRGRPRAGGRERRGIGPAIGGAARRLIVMSLKGKTLFTAGASGGIGLALALRAAKDGANIAIAAKPDTPHPKLKGTIPTAADEIEKAGGKALAIVCNVRE